MKTRIGWRAASLAVMLLAAVGATSVAAQERETRAPRGDEVFVSQGCYGCHQIGKFGTPIGPDLSRLGAKHSASYLRRWLRDPGSVRPSAHMPKLALSDDEIESLAAYLASLK